MDRFRIMFYPADRPQFSIMNQVQCIVSMLHSNKKRENFCRKRRVSYSVSKYQVFDTAVALVKCQAFRIPVGLFF